MESDPVKVDMCTCATCGYAWVRGRDGSHYCAEHLLKTVDEQKDTIDQLTRARVCSIDVNPGGVLVLEVDRPVSGLSRERIRQVVQDAFGPTVRAIVLDGGLRLAAVLRPRGAANITKPAGAHES